MPRVHELRRPPTPTTEPQRERRRRMLRAAADLGAAKGLEQVQMSEVAAVADVALGTLYRYFPSKHHLFAGLLASQVEHLPPYAGTSRDPATRVASVLVPAVSQLLTSLPLARAMIVSVNVVRAEHDTFPPFALAELIMRIAGRSDEEDRRIARLLEQTTYGVLTWATAGEIAPTQAAHDVDLACHLLLAPWSRYGSQPRLSGAVGAKRTGKNS